MIQFHVYPQGRKRIVTLSYDDGSANDGRLIALFNKYGVKASFHLNGANYIGKSEKELEQIRSLYAGHEISCHTLMHGWPARMPNISVVCEVLEDRKILEKIAGYPVTGMSYPSGSFSENVMSILNACGIVYSRTTKATMNFMFPENFLEWNPSCHQKDAAELCGRFLENIDSQWTHPLFYIWGHSHEFKTEDDWTYIEELLKRISNNEKIWYATNMEIYRYTAAQRNLVVSADETMFYNPSDTDVWIEKDKCRIIEVPAGKTVSI